MTRGWQPVCPRCIRRTTATLRSWLLTSGLTPICPCKPFSCKACPGIPLFRSPVTKIGPKIGWKIGGAAISSNMIVFMRTLLLLIFRLRTTKNSHLGSSKPEKRRTPHSSIFLAWRTNNPCPLLLLSHLFPTSARKVLAAFRVKQFEGLGLTMTKLFVW